MSQQQKSEEPRPASYSTLLNSKHGAGDAYLEECAHAEIRITRACTGNLHNGAVSRPGQVRHVLLNAPCSRPTGERELEMHTQGLQSQQKSHSICIPQGGDRESEHRAMMSHEAYTARGGQEQVTNKMNGDTVGGGAQGTRSQA